MKHLMDDAAKLGSATKALFMGFSEKGQLLKAVRASRPNWSEANCAKAASALLSRGAKAAQQFGDKQDYLSYIDIQLTAYTAEHPVAAPFPVADEMGLKRWEQRWQASRQQPQAQTTQAGDARHHEAV